MAVKKPPGKSVTPPEKRYTGWFHSVEPTVSGSFWVTGPAIEFDLLCQHKGDADTIAAALNLAYNFDAVKRMAKKLSDELEYITEFKVKS
jgi:hypothetical protein